MCWCAVKKLLTHSLGLANKKILDLSPMLFPPESPQDSPTRNCYVRAPWRIRWPKLVTFTFPIIWISWSMPFPPFCISHLWNNCMDIITTTMYIIIWLLLSEFYAMYIGFDITISIFTDNLYLLNFIFLCMKRTISLFSMIWTTAWWYSYICIWTNYFIHTWLLLDVSYCMTLYFYI